MQVHISNQNHRLGYLLSHWLGPFPHQHYCIHPQTQCSSICSILLPRTNSQHFWVHLTIVSSCFLSGPKGQWKDMRKETRWVLTLCYLGTLVVTLVLAFVLPDNLKVLVLISLILQMISYFLYTLSYVPFGRRLLKKLCQCLISE